MTDAAAFETRVKLALYETIARTTRVPTAAELASELGAPESTVREAFAGLHRQRLLLPEPGDPGRVRMAPPFSAVPTPFPVRVRDRTYVANCVWDALGVPAALHAEGVIETRDAHTEEPLRLVVGRDGPAPERCVAHFAVPAALWWDDLIHT